MIIALQGSVPAQPVATGGGILVLGLIIVIVVAAKKKVIGLIVIAILIVAGLVGPHMGQLGDGVRATTTHVAPALNGVAGDSPPPQDPSNGPIG